MTGWCAPHRSDTINFSSPAAKGQTFPARIVAIIFLITVVCSQPASADTLIPVRPDLVHHFNAGLIAGISGVSASSLIIRFTARDAGAASPPYGALSLWAVSVATAAGAAKEIADLFGGGVPDILDLVFTVAGGAAGGALGLYAAMLWHNRPYDRRSALVNIALTTGASAAVLFAGFVRSLADPSDTPLLTRPFCVNNEYDDM